MKKRPALGTRVRILGNTGLAGVAGQVGTVVDHHADGVSFVVRFSTALRPRIAPITCDPVNVRPAPRPKHRSRALRRRADG